MIHLIVMIYYLFQGATDCQFEVNFICSHMNGNYFNVANLFFQIQQIVRYLNDVKSDLDHSSAFNQVLFLIF